MKIRVCPKCGFEQPNDAYCANCGVNMDKFAAPLPSLFKRLKKNPWLIGIGVLFVALGAIVWINQNTAQNIEMHIKAMREMNPLIGESEIPQASSSSSTNAKAKSTVSAVQDGKKNEQKSVVVDPKATSPQALVPNKIQIPDEPQNAVNSFATEGALTVRLYFYEIKKDLMSQLMLKGDSVRSFSDYHSFLLKNSQKTFEKLQEQRKEEIVEIQNRNIQIPRDAPQIVSFGNQDPLLNSHVGLQLRFQIIQSSAFELQIDMEVQSKFRKAREDFGGLSAQVQPQIQIQTFQERPTFSPHMGFALMGLLPRRDLISEDESRIFKGNILEIMESTTFKSAESDLVLVVIPVVQSDKSSSKTALDD